MQIGYFPTRTLLLLALPMVAVFLFITRGSTQSLDKPFVKAAVSRAQTVPGEFLVRFRSESNATEAVKQGSQLRIDERSVKIGIEGLNAGDVLPGLRLVHAPSEDAASVLDALKARPDVLYAEPNFVRYQLATPNDPLYSDLWGLNTDGNILGTYIYGSAGMDIHAEEAWNITTGSRDVVVGVVDGGIDVSHPDLQANIWKNPGESANNGVDDDGNGYIDDINGFDFFRNQGTLTNFANPDYDQHATHVAGTIGAVGNNGEGVVGVNWQVSLMSLKVFGPELEAPFPSSVEVLVRAYVYARKMHDLWMSSGGTRGANLRVLNNSIGGYGRSQSELDAVQALNDAGILFVAAAGNYSRNNDVYPIYPAGYDVPNVISVAATSFGGTLTDFTNVGARTVTVSAPGLRIKSTTPFNTYSIFDGTSMASPHVAGAAALVCAAHPDISVSRLRAALIYNGDLDESQKYKTLTGRRLNAFKALNAVAENDLTPPGPISDFRIVAQNGRSVTLGWTAPGDDGTVGTSSNYEIKYSNQDLNSPEVFSASTTISPLAIPYPSIAGTRESATVELPFSVTSGFIGLQATDNMGNTSQIAEVPVSLPPDSANLYDVTESAPETVSSGGTRIQFFLSFDDSCSFDYALPFAFPFYGSEFRNVSVSTNGVLYFSGPPKFLLPPMTGDRAMIDASSSIRALQTNAMIAGMWDDLVITGVFAVIPDANHIIIRWEGNTFDTRFDDDTSRGVHPISFEIELSRDGTIKLRYGAGNENLFPVVGISGGAPNAYVVTSHTSENVFKNLGNAGTVTFAPRTAPATANADLNISAIAKTVNPDSGGGGPALPQGVVPGQTLQYDIGVTDLGPDAADNVMVVAHLPKGTSFTGCVAMTCSGPAPDTDGGDVTISFGTVGQFYYSRAVGGALQVKVNAAVGSTVLSSFSVSSTTPDPALQNNSAIETTLVARFDTLGHVVAITGQRIYTIALTEDGSVWLWGVPFGNSESDSGCLTTPRLVNGLSGITAIAGGYTHGLALKADGTVWSWGVNDRGQLGTLPGITYQAFPPTRVPGLTGIRMIAAAGAINFALDGNGLIWSWGDNSSGQLGDGTTTLRSMPVQVMGISGVRVISTSDRTAFAIKNDGTLWSWGDNSSGQLGNGSSITYSSTPVQVQGLTNVHAVAGAFVHAVAVKDDGTVWTWGYGPTGEFGMPYGSVDSSRTPIQVPGVTSVTAIAAGDSTSLALKSDGTVWLWGDEHYSPVQIDGLTNVSKINAQAGQFGAIMLDGTVKMWGSGSYGVLGNGTITGSNTPSPVKLLEVVDTPILSPGDSSSVFPRNILVTCETEGAIIHYTTNGLDPTEADAVVNSGGQIPVDHSMVVKARAWKAGWTPGKVATSVYTIMATGNPIDEPWSFVRQHYSDFLSRQPDQGGQDYWTSQLTLCGLDLLCMHNKRIDVSDAFFFEPEYQQTAAYVVRLYRAAYGNHQPFPNPDSGNPTESNKLISYQGFLTDRTRVIGGVDLPQGQQNLANTFVQRPEFMTKYSSNLDGPEFVDAILNTVKTEDGVDLTSQRAALIALFGNGGRGAVLYRLADENTTNPINNQAFIDEEYNRTFVLTQYFGYLRRDPDISGFLFWQFQINGAPLRDVPRQHALVCSFITSVEYQKRFSSIVTRNNTECPQ